MEQVETMKAPKPLSGAEMNKNLSTLSKSDGETQAPGPYASLGAAIAAELMIGFWFGIGVVLAVKTLESLEYCISRKCL